jgi:hypothetical protein
MESARDSVFSGAAEKPLPARRLLDRPRLLTSAGKPKETRRKYKKKRVE